MAVQNPGVPPRGALADYVAKRWGLPTTLVPPATVAVQTTATRVAKNNPRRFEITVVNLGTSVVQLGFDASVLSTTGITLNPLGGSVTFTADEDAELVGYELWCIAAAGPVNVWVIEVQQV